MKQNDMRDMQEARLVIRLSGDAAPYLFLLVQHGFSLKLPAPCPVITFLQERLGLSPDFIEDRIQTIFLDGKPVDDLDTAIVRSGSSLALSAAMPGLVGAAMRRGGIYGQLRSTITHRAGESSGGQGAGLIHMKVFNLLMHEMGPGLLEQGILLPSGDLSVFLSRQPESFWQGCRRISLEGRSVSRDALLGRDGLARYDVIRLSVRTGT